MHGDGFTPLPFKGFPGLDTSGNALDVEGSPDNLNVDYEPSAVKSRHGTSLLTSFGSPVLSIKEFVGLDSLTRRLLILTEGGTLWEEMGDLATYNVISAHLGNSTRMKSTTLFGREFMGFSPDGRIGDEDPRTYDDLNFDRMSHVGPGIPVEAADSSTAGSIAKGVHGARVFFKMRSGAWSPLSPPFEWTAAGGKKANVMFPTGPPNCVQRILAFTRAGDSRFFFLEGSAMEVKDNTTTELDDLDFTDEDLGVLGVSVEDLRDAFQLPPVAGVASYNNRTCVWGLRNDSIRFGDQGLLALDFNGGFNGDVPNGWTALSGGTSRSNPAGCVGDCLRITGDGSNQVGRLTNDYLAGKVLVPGVAYTARVRVQKSREGMIGTVHVYIASTAPDNLNLLFGNALIDQSEVSAGGEWIWIEKELISAEANIPGADWQLRISGGRGSAPPAGGGVPISAGDYFDIDKVMIYPSREKFLPSDIFYSDPFDPESFHFIRGRKRIAPGNGQAVRCAFTIRTNHYIAKERSLFMTGDNGDDPANWNLSEVSSEVGTSSQDGVAVADGWAILAAEAGPYFFNGAYPVAIGKELVGKGGFVGAWDRINKAANHKISVKIDATARKIFIAAPLDDATENSHIFTCTYFDDLPTGERKWTLLTIPANAMEISRRADGSRLFLFGRHTGLVKIDLHSRNDEGVAIDAFYRMPYVGNSTGRALLGGMTMKASGRNRLDVRIYHQDNRTIYQVPSPDLIDPMDKDIEWPVLRVIAERVSPYFGMCLLNGRWMVSRVALFAKPFAHAVDRGEKT